jgi:hypothetical protein
MFKWFIDWYGIYSAASATPKPNFKNGFQVNGTDYTATELNNSLNAGAGVSFGTAGTMEASKALVADASNYLKGAEILGSKQFQVQSPTASKGSVFFTKEDDATDLAHGVKVNTQAGVRDIRIADASTKTSSDQLYLAQIKIEADITNRPGALGCLLFATGNSKLYVCTTASATAATWTIIGTQS